MQYIKLLKIAALSIAAKAATHAAGANGFASSAFYTEEQKRQYCPESFGG
jgi:hypothetical protein